MKTLLLFGLSCLFVQQSHAITALTLTATSTNISCNGNADGAITANAQGGSAPYQYKLNNGSYQSSKVFSNLGPGYYVITVKGNNNDTAIANAGITEPADTLEVLGLVTNAGDSTSYDGRIDLYVAGGTRPYYFLWSMGTYGSVNTLSPGAYYVTVVDANGCSVAMMYTVDTGNIPPFLAHALVTDVSCYNKADGTVTVIATGGQGPYQYKLGNGSYQSSNVFSNVGHGTYTITVKDQLNDTVITGAAIYRPNQIFVYSGVGNASAPTAQDGFILTAVIGGNSPYTFLWSDAATTQNRNNILHGNYNITVTDSIACTANASFTVGTGATALSAFVIKKDASCYGDANGTIDVTAYGGTTPYSYKWNIGNLTGSVGGLSWGLYIVTITDGSNKKLIDSIAIYEGQPMVTSGFVEDIKCFGLGNGTAEITPYGGTPPYIYQWNNGATTDYIYNLSAGNYYVTITDVYGCQVSAVYPVISPAVLNVNAIGISDGCNTPVNGIAIAEVSGGIVPYTYLWDNQNTNDTITHLTAGIYKVDIKDANGCMATDSITFPAIPVLTGLITDTILNGHSSYVFGGQHIFTAGTYIDTIPSSNGCDSFVTLHLIGVSIDTAVSLSGFALHASQSNAQYQWINCANNLPVNGANGQTYTPAQTGAYACILTIAGFSDTTACYTVLEVGLNEAESLLFNIYPNPASNTLHVAAQVTGSLKYEVLNSIGEKLAENNVYHSNFEIDISNLSPGAYFVKLKSAAYQKVALFIKQ